MNFDSLGLSQNILKSVEEQGYKTPSPIQAEAIPAILNGKDVMAAAQTGTGKTAGFTLPILQKLSSGESAKPNHVRTLILAPTRELAIQVAESVSNYSKHLPLRSTVVYGGVKINPQMMQLRRGIDILVATPGRLLDLYQQNAVKFNQLEILVLDEADRMLDMGFIRDIKKIISLLPRQRQNLMFSATFSNDIRDLAKGLVNDPIEISVSPRNTTVKLVEQWVYPVDKKRKADLLSFLIGSNNWQQVLVFTRTKHGANRLTKHLIAAGIKSLAIHGNKSQGARVRALEQFKQNSIQVLVATDIAARGIDIEELPHVVNFDLPNVAEDYVHRIGRTGRAGSKGEAISLVSADESKQLSGIEKLIQKVIERKLIDGFEPSHDVPASRIDARPAKPKKPKSRTRYSDRNGNGNGNGANSNAKKTNRSTTRREKPKHSDSNKR
jgi:ATP-dependent RNA helicase RhlE